MKCIILIIFLITLCLAARLGDPYAILGVERRASSQEIKKAYKKLVREWHPDKNSSPEAEDKFVKISEAYKLLSDAERRKMYDTTGQTEEQHNPRRPPGGGFGHDPFDDLFNSFGGGGSFRFTFNEGTTSYAKRAINMKSYESTMLPRSKKQPYLLLFFSDWCLTCSQIEPIWQRLVEELEPINFAMTTVHAGKETALMKKLGVKTVPYLIFLLDGHPYHYTQPSLSMASSLDFIRNKFPNKLVQRITEENLNNFLGGWMDNKIRVLLFGRLDIIRLRYLTVAWEFKDRAVVGYVQMGRADTDKIRERYSVSNKADTLLVFHEDPFNPVASVAMTDLPYATMKTIIETNKFLMLPRLSSQTVFDALCPVESAHSRRRLCVVLVTQDSPNHDTSRAALREYAFTGQFKEKERLRFTYIFREKQTAFVNSLTAGVGSPEASDLHIVIIWRRDPKHLRYEWVSEKWRGNQDSHNKSKETLQSLIHKLLYTNDPMPFEAEIQELFDEHAQSIVWRIINRLAVMHDYLRERISFEDFIPTISFMATVLFVILGGYVLSYLVKLEDEKLGDKVKNFGKDGHSSAPQLKIHELRGETYNGLIRLLKPGCRTIVLLCDPESKPKLMPKFHKACWPYRKNKTLMFAFLNIERNSAIEWYKRLLTLGLPEPRELNINPKNTVGTVISLNGHRKYFCIYHAKHPEDTRISESASQGGLNKRHRHSGTNDIMGFSETDSSNDSDPEIGSEKKDSVSSDKPLLNYYSNILFEEHLLDGLSNWLDRLFEGSTTRYHINYWMEWPGK